MLPLDASNSLMVVVSFNFLLSINMNHRVGRDPLCAEGC